MQPTTEQRLMRRIAAGACGIDQLHQQNADNRLALNWLIDQKYVEAWGATWETTLFVATQAGRDWLEDNDATND